VPGDRKLNASIMGDKREKEREREREEALNDGQGRLREAVELPMQCLRRDASRIRLVLLPCITLLLDFRLVALLTSADFAVDEGEGGATKT